LERLSPAERLALGRFAGEARSICGSRLIELRAYGSRVRGEGHALSDLDVFVLLQEPDRATERLLDDLAADLHLETGVLLDPRVWGKAEWETWLRHERALALAIAAEGVLL
jgi:predicted nucleotidyltransferase